MAPVVAGGVDVLPGVPFGVPDSDDVGVGQSEVRVFFDAQHVPTVHSYGLDQVALVGVEPDLVEVGLACLGDLTGQVLDDGGRHVVAMGRETSRLPRRPGPPTRPGRRATLRRDIPIDHPRNRRPTPGTL